MGAVTEDACCAKCGAGRDVAWCWAWGEWLCAEHRHQRAYRELDATQRPDGWLEARAREVTVTLL